MRVEEATDRRMGERAAILWLLVACVLWGMSFNWNKEGQALLGERLTAATGDPGMPGVAPAAFPAIRFAAAVVFCVAAFPSVRTRWTRGTWRAGLIGGSLLSGGMLLQHYGLAYTTESLSSFLTSLTVLFTPLFATVVLRHRVGAPLWGSVACATAGVALMTVYREEGHFDLGAMLGLLCAVVFSAHILVVDHFGKREAPWPFTVAQFAVAAVVFTAYSAIRAGGGRWLRPEVLLEVFASPRLVLLAGVATVFATLITFGIMVRYQPRTTPTRAALTYLTEPLFATVYAWIVAGRTIGLVAMVGAGLIILGNVLAEYFARRNSVAGRAADSSQA
jgi:drug/metabolite transporter (DMT)-like permease